MNQNASYPRIAGILLKDFSGKLNESLTVYLLVVNSLKIGSKADKSGLKVV